PRGDGLLPRADRDGEDALARRHRQGDAATAVGGVRRPVLAWALRLRPDEIDLDKGAGRGGLVELDLQGGGGAPEAEAFLGDQPLAPHREQPLRRGERREQQQPRGLSRPVLLLVGDELYGLLLGRARLRLIAGDPDGDLALVLAALAVG